MSTRLTVVLATAVISLTPLLALHAQQQGPNQPGTTFTDEQLRQSVELARVGRKLTPKRWPNESRVAVCLSFDTDTEAPLLRDGNTSAHQPVSVRLRRRERHASHPENARPLPDSGDVLHDRGGCHAASRHARRNSEERTTRSRRPRMDSRVPAAARGRRRGAAARSGDRLPHQGQGKRPAGYRAPSWAFSASTLDLIQKKGFLYDSSLQALDEPYEIVSHGKNTGLIEPAIDWTLTETPYLGQNGRMPSPELLYQLYKDEFDGAYEEGTLFVLTLHPYLSGHRAPMRHLNKFVAYMKSKPGVWFATGEQVATYLKNAH